MSWYIVLVLCVLCGVRAENCRGEEARERACENLCDETGNCTVRAALLLPRNTAYDASLTIVESTLELALQQEAIKQAFPDWVQFEWMSYDVQDCDAAYAVIGAIDAYNDCAHVFFGPSCDFALASVARIAKFLGSTGTPMMTTGGFSFDFVEPKQNCSNEFYMLVRAGPVGFKDLAFFIIDIMRHFEWGQLLLITEPEAQVNVAGKSSCLLMMKSLANYLKKEEIIYTPWDTTSDAGLNYTENLKIYLNYKYTNNEEQTQGKVLEARNSPLIGLDEIEVPSELKDPTIEENVTIDPDFLSALGDPAEESPTYGEKISPLLADRWLPILRKGIDSKECKDKILKEYKIPENCKLLKAPTLNAEIAAVITDITRNRDKKIESAQQQLGVGISAINKAMTLLLTSDDKSNKVQALKILSDGCRILSDLHFTETQARTKLITPGLDRSFLNVMQDCERDETLFGNKLSEKIKASKAIEKQGLQIKKSQACAKSSTPSIFQPSTSTRSRSQGNWTGPARFQSSNRGGRAGPQKTFPFPTGRRAAPAAVASQTKTSAGHSKQRTQPRQ